MTEASELALAMSRRRAATRADGLSRPILNHIVKLLAADASEATRAHWRAELRGWLDDLAVIRLKPTRRRPTRAMHRDWLFGAIEDDPVAGVEIELRRPDVRRLRRNDRTPVEIADRLGPLLDDLAGRLATGASVADLVDGLGAL
jgi:hypothetical protein